MAWTVSLVNEEDEKEILACARIGRIAFADSEINKYIRPAHKRRDLTESQRNANDVRRFKASGEAIRLKATNQQGDIAGIAVWLQPQVLEDYHAREVDPSKQDVELDYQAKATFEKTLMEALINAIGRQQHWELVALATDPAFRRQGVAAALLDWGLQKAKEDNLTMLLGAVPSAVPVYDKAGFQRRGEYNLDYKRKDSQGNETGEFGSIRLIIMTK